MSDVSRREFLLGTTLAITAGAALASAALRAQRGGLGPGDRRAIEGLAAAFTQKYEVPGLSFAIAKDDRLVHASALGLADTAGEKLTTRHRFRIASVSKPITSVTVMSLIEQGRLALDDRVFGDGSVLGRVYGTPPYGPHVGEITVRHLLTHTGGGWSNEGPDPDPMFTNPTMSRARLISWTLDNLPLRHAPGDHYAYSNFGFCVLGRVIEKVTGVGYAEYVRDNVLKQCGVREMEIAGNTKADRKPLEVAYTGRRGENPYGMNVSRMDAHGGWIATPTDLVRLLVRVDGFAARPDILSAATIREMTTGSSANAGYAKGWIVNRNDNWWHDGSLPGSITLMVRTSAGMCWAALTNTRQPGTQMALDLDRLIWNMVGKVTEWPQGDLF